MITKAKFTYVEARESQTMGAQHEDKPSPLVGKSYVVWREGDAVKVTREDGAAPSPEELALVEDDHENLGTPDPMDMVVASKTWTTGTKVVFTPDELATINARGGAAKPDEEQLTSAALTLTGVDDGVARFDMEIGLTSKRDRGTMTMRLVGTAGAEVATGRLLEMKGTGPFEADMGARVTGTMTMNTVEKY
jgi:hypothetical protein